MKTISIILEDECKSYYYTGDSKKKDRDEAGQKADILFATFAAPPGA